MLEYVKLRLLIGSRMVDCVQREVEGRKMMRRMMRKEQVEHPVQKAVKAGWNCEREKMFYAMISD